MPRAARQRLALRNLKTALTGIESVEYRFSQYQPPERGNLGKPTGSPGKLERAAFPQYGPFPASPCRRAVNQKAREFVVGLCGSADMAQFESSLQRG